MDEIPEGKKNILPGLAKVSFSSASEWAINLGR